MTIAIDRLAVDTSAVVDLMRPDRPDPAPLHAADTVFLPLPVLGELLVGAYSSRYVDKNLAEIHGTIAKWIVVTPDTETARIYGQIRAALQLMEIGESKRNDLWVAATCVQHDLPLLVKDGGFDTIPNLKTLRW